MTTTTEPTVTKIDLDRVVKVYSGKIGCACGCSGKYAYASTAAIEADGSGGTVNLTLLRRHVATMNRLIAGTTWTRVCRSSAIHRDEIEFEGQAEDRGGELSAFVDADGAYLSIEQGRHVWTVYFKS